MSTLSTLPSAFASAALCAEDVQVSPLNFGELTKKVQSLRWGWDKIEGQDRHEYLESKLHPHLAETLVRALDEARDLEQVLQILEHTKEFTSKTADKALRFVRDSYDFDGLFIRLKLTAASVEKFRSDINKIKFIDYMREQSRLSWKLSDTVINTFNQKRGEAFVRDAVRRDQYYTRGFLQWMAWETTANHERLTQDVGWISVRTTIARPYEISYTQIKTIEIPELRDDFNYLIPQHPYNTDPTVPFAFHPAGPNVEIHLTASRSVLLKGTTVTLKLPTDHPSQALKQPDKANLREEAPIAIARGQLIQRIDNKLGKDKKLTLLYDVASILHSETGNGVIARDISIFNNGNYWFPSHSIETLGAKIARAKNLKESRSFWIEHYVKPIARAKALLLLRYGLQADYLHLQNSLTEFDPQMNPLDHVALRDMADTTFVRAIAEIVAPEELKADLARGTEVTDILSPALGGNTRGNPFRRTSMGALPSAIVLNATPEEEKNWGNEEFARDLHRRRLLELENLEEQFFIEYVREELKLTMTFATIQELQKYLFSPEGLDKIRQYHHK